MSAFWGAMRGIVVVVCSLLMAAYFERDLGVWLAIGTLAIGFIVAWYVPALMKYRHVASQNSLLSRCRALFILGARAHENGDRVASEAILARIRRLEWFWWIGDSWVFRVTLAIWAVVWAAVACVLARLAGMLLMRHLSNNYALTIDGIISDLWVAAVLSLLAPLYALFGYVEAWKEPWAIDDCGDRLHHIMFGPRSVSTKRRTDGPPTFDGMTPQQIFGLDQVFSRRELERARRRLVKEFHPDLWHWASEQERQAREEAMKRINVAYDLLRERAR